MTAVDREGFPSDFEWRAKRKTDHVIHCACLRPCGREPLARERRQACAGAGAAHSGCRCACHCAGARAYGQTGAVVEVPR